ncbi:MAG: MBL fold metallo-hydrolase, partial [Helicobacter sp.]|nr:MBL fold metallo-hydrolase [Helicobacter sp.]
MRIISILMSRLMFCVLFCCSWAVEMYHAKMGSAEVVVLSLTRRDINTSILLPQNDAEKNIIYQYRTPFNEHNIVLVKAPNYNLLVDTGFASTTTALQSALKELGLQFGDITHVLITHGHGDHVGAILNEKGENNFPNATLMLDKKEYDFWAKSSNDTARKAFESFGDKRVFIEHNINLFPQSTLQIVASPAYGHTAGHITVQFTHKDDTFIFFADLLHNFAVQTHGPQISTTYDH